MQLSILNFLLRALLAFLFIVAAVGKLRAGLNPGGQQTLYDLWIATGSIGHYLFIGGEFLLGAWLLSGLYRRSAAGVALLVLAIFSGLIAFETTRHAPRDCGCIGGGRVVEVTPEDVRKGLYQRLMMNGVFMLAAFWVAVMPADPPPRSGPDSARGSPAGS